MMSVSRSRQARLYVSRIDPWSVAKVAFVLSVAIGIIMVIATALLWLMLDSLGVFDALARNVNEIVGGAGSDFDLLGFFSFTRIVGGVLVITSVEIVLISVLAAIFAILYNITVALTGGVEVVLTD